MNKNYFEDGKFLRRHKIYYDALIYCSIMSSLLNYDISSIHKIVREIPQNRILQIIPNDKILEFKVKGNSFNISDLFKELEEKSEFQNKMFEFDKIIHEIISENIEKLKRVHNK
jgi:hypothetical protein